MFKQKTNWFVAVGISIAGYILDYLDKTRILEASYKCYVIQKRQEIKLRKTKELKHRLMAFPASTNMKYTKKFVISEVTKFHD